MTVKLKEGYFPESMLVTLLIAGTWFGIVTGLVEGAGLFTVSQLADYRLNESLVDVSAQCLWISPIVDMMLFCGIGLILSTMALVIDRSKVWKVSIFTFTFLMLLDWMGIILGQWLAPYAITLLVVGIAVYCTRILFRHFDAIITFWRYSLLYLFAVTVIMIPMIQTILWWDERTATNRLKPKAGLPNVLVVVADTLRVDRLSCYGYHRQTSPNIDRFADEGMLFSAAFSTCSWTSPSHASILTGLYPSEHGVEWDKPRALLHNDVPILSEVLLEQGYRTGAFSANIFWFTRPFGFGRGFIHFEDYYHSLWDMVLRTLYGRVFKKLIMPRLGFEDIPARKKATDINSAFLSWIDNYPNHPFFAFLNYMDTHDPYLPPEPFRSSFSESPKPGGLINDHLGRNCLDLTPEQLRSESDAYDGAVTYLDDQFASLLRELDIRGLQDNTLIIFTSDHGESFGEHGMILHGHSLSLEVIHVPLILRLPDRIKGGVRVDQIVSNAAIPATVMDVIGLKPSEIFTGISLIKEGSSSSPVEIQNMQIGPFAIAELKHRPWEPEIWPVQRGSIRAVVIDNSHFIQHDAEAEKLYHWRDDPAELKDLIKTSGGAEAAAQAREVLKRMIP